MVSLLSIITFLFVNRYDLSIIGLLVSPLIIPFPHVDSYSLHLPGVLDKLRYRYAGKSIIYTILCRTTQTISIGSTFTPDSRFRRHIIIGNGSNAYLQAAVSTIGLSSFTCFVFKVVE